MMKTQSAFFVIVLGLAGCATTTPDSKNSTNLIPDHKNAVIKRDEGAVSSYDLALLHVKTLREGGYVADMQAYERGLKDALDGKNLDEIPTKENDQTAWLSLAKTSTDQMKLANLKAGNIFLERNKARKEVTVLPSGLQYEVLQSSKDTHKPSLTDTVGIIYKITGIDGSVKTDFFVKGNTKMFEIPLQSITSKGWQEALLQMPLESKWRLYIPSELAFGEKGVGEKGIQPNETIVIETLLLDIKLSR